MTAGRDKESALGEDRLRRLIEAARSLVSERRLDAVLDRLLVVTRELTDAQYAAIGVLDDSRTELADFITAGLSERRLESIGALPRGRGVLGLLISNPEPLRLDDVGAHPLSYGFPPGHPPMTTFLGVPIVVRGEAWGNLYLTDKRGGPFDAADEEAVTLLATWAAIALENARLYRQMEHRRAELERSLEAEALQRERLRHSVRSAEAERRRWARMLHDETLQSLGGLRVLLASASRRPDEQGVREIVEGVVEQLGDEISNLRAMITELRPPVLDQLGLAPALDTLLERARTMQGLELEATIDFEEQPGGTRLDPDVETAIYRVVQESLGNVMRHARAKRVEVEVIQSGLEIRIAVRDDGVGFDPRHASDGFGVAGMRERIGLAGGRFSISSSEAGTVVHALLPARPPGARLG
ncbi:MAG TPA: GAF domain-containing sensor histidine kinase [Solirubrobacteraceae bacterium]|jgi:signal transduction histidine kinase